MTISVAELTHTHAGESREPAFNEGGCRVVEVATDGFSGWSQHKVLGLSPLGMSAYSRRIAAVVEAGSDSMSRGPGMPSCCAIKVCDIRLRQRLEREGASSEVIVKRNPDARRLESGPLGPERRWGLHARTMCEGISIPGISFTWNIGMAGFPVPTQQARLESWRRRWGDGFA